MTPHDELDLQLRGWMQRRATLAPRSDLADGIVARTATVRQRPAVLAPSGEGATGLRIDGLVGGRRAILLIGALLALLAMVGVFAGSRPPADRGRLLVSVGATFHLIEPDGRTIARTLAPSAPLDGAVPASAEPCSSIIAGTDVVTDRDRYGAVQFASIGDPDARIPGVSTNFASSEWWSPDRRRLLLVQGRAVTVVDLSDPSRPERRRFELGSLGGAALNPDGRRLVVALRTLGHVSLQVLDVATGQLRSSMAAAVEPPAPGEGSLSMSLSPDGSLVAIQDADGSAGVLVDTATGAIRVMPLGTDVSRARWSPDGRWLAAPTAWDGVWLVPAGGGEPTHLERDGGLHPRRLAWSPDGSRLAFRLGPAELVTVAPDGSRWTEHPLLSGAFVWSPDGSIVVVRSSADHGSTFVERFRPESDEEAERIATLPGASGDDADGSLCIEWASAPAGP